MSKKPNHIAKNLRTPLYRKRIVAARRGAGSYKREKINRANIEKNS